MPQVKRFQRRGDERHRNPSMAGHAKCSYHRRPRIYTLLIIGSALVPCKAETSFQVHPRDISLPLRVTNNCNEPIWPAILTQNGRGPASSGFVLQPGDTNPQTVSGDWRGRVWGRTNCTFPGSGSGPSSGRGGVACTTGDCGSFLECPGAVCLSLSCLQSRKANGYPSTVLISYDNV